MVSLLSTRRTRVFAGVTAALVLGGIALAGPTAARMMAPPPIDGTGTVTCNVNGSLGFDPPLQASGTATVETVTLRAHLTQCSGTGDAVNIKTGSALVSGTTTSNDCLTVLTTPPTEARSGPLKWVVMPHTQKLNPSTIQFTSLAHSQVPPITIDTGGSATAGSFAGDPAVGHSVVRDSVTSITKRCLNAKGLKAIHFVAGSTFTLAAP